MARLEETGLPFAPITRPEDLFDDAHLNSSGGLLEMTLPDGQQVKLPALPISIGGQRPTLELDPPRPGANTEEILREIGFSRRKVLELIDQKVVEAARTE